MTIKMKNLEKVYGSRKILEIESLSFEKGSINGIIGANGAGKTTLLRIIAGLEDRYRGEIEYFDQYKVIDGRGLNRLVMQRITYLSQTPYMLSQTVYENVAYPLKLRKVPLADESAMVLSLLDQLSLSHLKDQLATKLSGGEAQKVALARGLVFSPELLLLDEPTASIDPETTELIERVIREYKEKTKMTVVTISHNLEHVNRLCEKTYVMEGGKCIQLESLRPVTKDI